MRWGDLRQVRYAGTLKWFVLTTRAGVVVRVSALLRGLPQFARTLLRHTPADAIERQTLPVLEATAAGNPPSLWD